MAKLLTRPDLYQLNTIATRRIIVPREELVQVDLHGVHSYETRNARRTRYLKICWNCGSAYESGKYNSYACDDRCSWNINYKLKRGVNPPANMLFLTKTKNVKRIMEEFGYL